MEMSTGDVGPPPPSQDEWRLLTALLGELPDVVMLVRPDGTFASGTTFAPIGPLGYGLGDRTDAHIAERVHPDDLPAVLDAIERAKQDPGLEQTARVRVRHVDGRWVTFESTAVSRLDHPVLAGYVVRSRVVDEGIAPQLSSSEDGRFVSLAEAVPVGILSADTNGYVVYANGAAQRLLGLPLDSLCGDGWQKVIDPADLPGVADAVENARHRGESSDVSFRAHTNSSDTWLHATVVPLRAGTATTGWLATLQDVTQQRRQEAELAFFATHDQLTLLPNRYLLHDRLDQSLARLGRSGPDRSELAVLVVDLDNFKDINDTCGHAAGDQVLQEVAKRIKDAARANDSVARVGGDEFVIICDAIAPGEAQRIARRITATLGRPIATRQAVVSVGASVGITTTADPAMLGEDLLEQADAAMYQDKLKRRDGRS